MDLLSGTGVATALRNVKWSKALPYAGSTIAVRLVFPKNKPLQQGEGAHITFWTELVAKHAHQTYLQWLSNITMQS